MEFILEVLANPTLKMPNYRIVGIKLIPQRYKEKVRIMALGNMNIGVDSEFIPFNLNTVLTPPQILTKL